MVNYPEIVLITPSYLEHRRIMQLTFQLTETAVELTDLAITISTTLPSRRCSSSDFGTFLGICDPVTVKT